MGGGGVMGRSSERFRTFSTMYVPSIRISGLKFYLLVQLREVEGGGGGGGGRADQGGEEFGS